APPLLQWGRRDVVDADGAAAVDDRGGRYGHVVKVAYIGGEILPHRFGIEDLAEPVDGHMKADRADIDEGVAGAAVADAAAVKVRKRLDGREEAVGHHTGEFGGEVQAMLLKDFARALAEAGLHPVLAHPVGPLEPPRLEVDRWQKDALHQLGFGGDGL